MSRATKHSVTKLVLCGLFSIDAVPSKHSSSFLVAMENILQELECPVCWHTMLGEISQCVKGHSFCKQCKSNLTQCPLCKDQLGNNRNFALENVATSLKLEIDKEKKQTQAPTIKKNNIGFKCGLYFTGCEWRGKMQEMKQHLEEEHQNYLHRWNKLDCRDYHKCSKYQINVIIEGENIFFVYFKRGTYETYYSAIHMAPDREVKEHSFKIEFQDQSESGLHLSGEAPCLSFCDIEKIFDRATIKFENNMLKPFMKDDCCVSVFKFIKRQSARRF